MLISCNSYLCPNCHFATFFQHHQSEFRDWNKCKHCGYMELNTETVARIKLKLIQLSQESPQKPE